MYIERNLAMTKYLKTATTLLSLFKFEPIEHRSTVRLVSAGTREMEREFLSRVKIRGPVKI